jgi:galactokinase
VNLPSKPTLAHTADRATAASDPCTKRIFQAPGRVNLIGEHTDYNDGYVLPVAIDLCCTVEVAPSSDGRLTVYSLDLGKEHSWAISELDAARPVHDWSDYVGGVAIELQRRGVPIPSAVMEIHSTLPMGAGLSSSASLEIAVALALATVAGSSLSRRELAVAALAAEQNFVGTRCGIMDQLIAVSGLPNHALFIDCRSLEYRAIPLPLNVEIVMVNTMVPHQLSSGQYNVRRDECEEAARLLGTPLRDISAEELLRAGEKLPERLMRRARHIVTENSRVLEFVRACERNDLAELGRLMAASHHSLSSDFEVSCPELDFLVEEAALKDGVVGTRMTGGGFGGCTVNLVRPEAVGEFRRTVTAAYERRFGLVPDVYCAHSAGGAAEITL